MLSLIANGHYTLFTLIIIALIISLTFHEYGHAAVAKIFGDDTAQRAGRLTLNPVAHLDPMGLLMVVLVGFGYAKPVPTDPRNFRSKWASFWVAAAGPGMNLFIALVTINVWVAGMNSGIASFSSPGVETFVAFLVSINLLLMLFNLIPLGPLDGHYMMPYLLPKNLRRPYAEFNYQYGHKVLLAVIVLSILGVPIFKHLMAATALIIPYLVWV